MFTVAAALAGVVGVGYLGLKLFYPWVLKDIQYIKMVMPHVRRLGKHCKDRYFLADIFEDKAKEQPDKVFVIFEDKTYSYKFMNEQANRVARAATKLGFKRGDTVAMVFYNEPAFLWTYLGFLKMGVIVAFINVNQRAKSLLHSLKIANANYILIGEGTELVEAVAEVIDELPETSVYVQGCPKDKLPKNFESFHDVMKEMPCDNLDSGVRDGIKPLDPVCYIFTSGTTGLPKAAVISQKKMLQGMIATGCAKLAKDDVMMIPLPLYHTSALVLGFASVIIAGSSLILCRKFSASNFWNICRKHNATSFLYIGELCRYLLARPPIELDKTHNLRFAMGNGLRQDIYQQFQNRFAIPWVMEFYGSTEGPLGFVNALNVTGSCGRHSPLLNKLLSAQIVQYDVEKEEPVRNEEGLCIPVKKQVPGLLLAEINKLQTYDGYRGRKDLSESKIIRNVVKEGDQYFNTGDMFTFDSDYNLYFNDRVGDTFRWKGENVSTTEVSNILTDLEFIVDACVYGVPVPGHDGKAGMAALLLRQDLTTLDESCLTVLSAHCTENIPTYARPLFLRIPKELQMTSTIKQNKVIYKENTFDKTQISDELFCYDKDEAKYKPLTFEVYKEIMDKTYKF